jgi:hypothetical protein
MLPDGEIPKGGWGAYGVRRLSAAEKERRRRKEKLAKKQRQRGRKKR